MLNKYNKRVCLRHNLEENMNITFGNKISVEEFNFLRKSVGWGELEYNVSLKSIENALFIVTAIIEEKIIGLTRVSGDGGYILVIADVIVLPEYQGKGIGKKLMAKAMEYINNDFLQNGQTAFLNLMSAKGRESFYGKFGFENRPNEKFGAGMSQWITKE
jgi:GNAT superfamily N-acetyltransferase